MVHNICQRNLTETEEKNIAHFRYYYDSKRSFALIGDHVVVGLSEENAGDLEKLKQEAGELGASLSHTERSCFKN